MREMRRTDGIPTLDRLRQRLLDAMRPLVDQKRPVALLDFPREANVGDAAIWLGEIAWLRALGVRRVVYTAEVGSYCRRALAAKVGEGTILLHGGGNFGDQWPAYQEFRERVVQDFPDNRVIVLPQTVFFSEEQKLRRAARIFNRHQHLVLLIRDHDSLERLRNVFDAQLVLCPDSAFALHLSDRVRDPLQDFLFLARTDKEASGPARELGPMFPTVDWVNDRAGLALMQARVARKLIALSRGKFECTRLWLSSLYGQVAEGRLDRGCELLSRGRVVITDRLHGHILCSLLGIPHVVLENSYGKIGPFYRTWTAEIPYARMCDHPRDAPRLARELLVHGR